MPSLVSSKLMLYVNVTRSKEQSDTTRKSIGFINLVSPRADQLLSSPLLLHLIIISAISAIPHKASV